MEKRKQAGRNDRHIICIRGRHEAVWVWNLIVELSYETGLSRGLHQKSLQVSGN